MVFSKRRLPVKRECGLRFLIGYTLRLQVSIDLPQLTVKFRDASRRLIKKSNLHKGST